VQASKQSSGVETEAVFALLPSDTCVTQAEGSITYSNCNFGGVTFNGTVSISGDIIKIDIDMKMNQEGKPMDITSTGSVTVTDTTIGGSLTFLYKTKDSGYDVTNVVHVDYGSIEVAGGCPTSGSLDASYDVAVLGLPDGLPQSAISAICYSVTVKFGPNCGNMKVYG
jgi:hypothetical protein